MIHIYDHHHIKKLLYDGLGNVQNVDLTVCQIGTDFRNDSYGIFSNYCDNGLVHAHILLFYMVMISDI